MTDLVRGLDAASAIQGRLPVAALRAEGIEYCFLRGKVGNNPGRDALFEENIRALRGAGIRSAPYEFPFPLAHLDPVEQAKGFADASAVDGELVGSKVGDLMPGYDLEWPPPEQWAARGIDADYIVDFAIAQLARMTSDWGCAPVVYSYPYFIASLAKAKNFALLLRYRLWLAGGANYLNGNGVWPGLFAPPKVPGWPLAAVLFWQWDGNGGRRLPGTNVDADFDVFAGTLADLDKLCGKDAPPDTLSEAPPAEQIAFQAAAVLVDDGVHAYRQERADKLLAAA